MEQERREQGWFHLGVFAGSFYGLGAVLTVPLALRSKHPAWRKRLIVLAIVDLIVAATLLCMLPGWIERKKTPPPAPSPRIGVTFKPGIVLDGVYAGSPAEKAGLQGGDRVLAVDGRAPASEGDFRDVIAATPTGGTRTVAVERSGQRLEVAVEPSSEWLPATPLRVRGPFEADPWLEAAPTWSWTWDAGEWVWAAEFGAFLALALAARRRGAPAGPGVVMIAAKMAAVLVALAAYAWLRHALAASYGGYWLSLGAGDAAMAAVAVIALAPRGPEALPPKVAFQRGFVYCIGGLGRLGVLLAPLRAVLTFPIAGSEKATSSWSGLLVLSGLVVLMGPVAEELLYRGVLLPWLARWMRPAVAIGVSAVIFGAMHYTYGVWVAGPMLIGAVLGWMRLSSGRLGPGIALHVIINGFATVRLLGKH